MTSSIHQQAHQQAQDQAAQPLRRVDVPLATANTLLVPPTDFDFTGMSEKEQKQYAIDYLQQQGFLVQVRNGDRVDHCTPAVFGQRIVPGDDIRAIKLICQRKPNNGNLVFGRDAGYKEGIEEGEFTLNELEAMKAEKERKLEELKMEIETLHWEHFLVTSNDQAALDQGIAALEKQIHDLDREGTWAPWVKAKIPRTEHGTDGRKGIKVSDRNTDRRPQDETVRHFASAILMAEKMGEITMTTENEEKYAARQATLREQGKIELPEDRAMFLWKSGQLWGNSYDDPPAEPNFSTGTTPTSFGFVAKYRRPDYMGVGYHNYDAVAHLQAAGIKIRTRDGTVPPSPARWAGFDETYQFFTADGTPGLIIDNKLEAGCPLVALREIRSKEWRDIKGRVEAEEKIKADRMAARGTTRRRGATGQRSGQGQELDPW